MLGELYTPRGKAYETAKAILEAEPMACNLAWGCHNACIYCYVPYIDKGQMHFPKTPPPVLVERQLESGVKPKGVFLSFATDPFLEINRQNSDDVIKTLLEGDIRVATLSKVGVADTNHVWRVRTGMTIVSDSEEFRKRYEPNALPIAERIKTLMEIHENGGHAWISLEPYPTPKIWEQKLERLMDKIGFVNFIIFGKWNYEKLANDREFYREAVEQFEKYCRSAGIRHFVKSETKEFVKKR